LAFYLIGQAKTGISSLELSRHLGVNDDTAWLLHKKIQRAMSEREDAYVLRGKIQMDEAYLSGELPGGKAGPVGCRHHLSLQPPGLLKSWPRSAGAAGSSGFSHQL